ncbi:MAG: hypothetical protein KatS3mg102_2039 [Planctomycetota bacterium]|nr:MAG: hypothetical protein KatS3mg102_2039 [Planctomycetota bacterium]
MRWRCCNRFLGLGSEQDEQDPELAAGRARACAVAVDPRRLPLTARDLAGPLAFEEAERRVAGRRLHEVAAARYRAWMLLADAYTSLGRPAAAARARARAPAELQGVPEVLLAEVEQWLGPEAEQLRARARAAEEGGPQPAQQTPSGSGPE